MQPSVDPLWSSLVDVCSQGAALWLVPGALSLALMGATLVVARREARALVRVTPGPLEGALTILIPARDEAERIGATLDALLADPSPTLRILVYDDRSTDDTRALVEARMGRDARLVLIDGSADPPPVYCGKPAALARALEHADAAELPTRERVLFLDADVVLAPGALGGIVRALEESGARALSGLPRLVVHSLSEVLLVPAFVGLAARRYPPSKVHEAHSPVAFLNGQLILIERAALDEVGGFGSVEDSILEDVALAARLKGRGHALRLADLRAVAETRMYSTVGDILEGFGKNAVPLQGGLWATAVVGLLSFALSLGAPLTLLGSFAVAPGPCAFVGGLLFGLVLLAQMRARRTLEVPAWPAWLAPLSYAVVAFVFVRSALRVATKGEVRWRGRRYPAGRR